MNQKYMIYMYLLKARTFIALLLVIAFFSVMVPNFLTASNLLIMTQHVAITGLLAIGMTLVILTGGIDLSVGDMGGCPRSKLSYLEKQIRTHKFFLY